MSKVKLVAVACSVLVVGFCCYTNCDMPKENNQIQNTKSSACVTKNSEQAKENTAEHIQYGDPKYLKNMIHHKFARKDAAEKKLKNPRVVLKSKNASLREGEWSKYIADIQAKIKELELKDITDKNYLDNYIRINKEFAQKVIVPAGFISTSSVSFDSMEYVDEEISRDELEWEMSLEDKLRDKNRIKELQVFLEQFKDPSYNPYGSRGGFLIQTTGVLRYDDEALNKIRQNTRDKVAAIVKDAGCDELIANRIYYKLFDSVRKRLFCVSEYSFFEYPGLEEESVRYCNCLANRDMTRRYLVYTVDFDGIVSRLPVDKRSSAKDKLIEAAVDLVHEIGMIDGVCNKNIEQTYSGLFDIASKISPDKWSGTESERAGVPPRFDEHLSQIATAYLLNQYFVLDIAYDDVDDYGRKDGEPGISILY